MARKRCLTGEVIGSGAFTALPPRAQLLYIQMVMVADDDGVVSNPLVPMALSGGTQKDLETLKASRFILEAGRVLVVKHWWLHQNFRKDRYHQSPRYEDLNRLFIRPDKVYTDHPSEESRQFAESLGLA